MKTLLRAAAIAVASTALVAGGTTAATAAPGDTAAVTGVSLGETATYFSSTPVTGTVSVAGGITSLKATVNVNGVPLPAPVTININASNGVNGFYYDRAWGNGVVSLTNFIASGRDAQGFFSNRAVPGPANSVLIRYAVDTRSSIKVTKRGKKLTFKLKARYINNTGGAVGIRKATIQVKKNGTWKTLKNVKLKSNGTGTYKKSDSKKRNYRLLIKTTSSIQGGNTTGTRKL